MGFYKDGKWQPSANEIAAGEYSDGCNQARPDILSQAIEILTDLVAVAEATNNGNHSGEIDLSDAIAFINRISGYEEDE